MHCIKCGTDNREGRRFCAQCGQPLKPGCPACGASNEPGERFCGDCGSALAGHVQPSVDQSPKVTSTAPKIRVTPEQPDASTAVDGERKTVTALFADIKGSTELMEDLDPEEARAIIDPALELMIDAVHRYDGYVVQSTGDGIFALFGAPVAHEDHPQRALYAALRMQEELKRYSAKVVADGRTPVQGRVGINTGEVVVRSIQTGAGNVEYTPIGHTTNLASRMQTAAPVGSIAVAEGTRRLCEGYFTLKPLGATRVKGVTEPVNIYEVTGVGPLRTRLQRSAGRGLSRFVGREREIEEMKRALGRAIGARGQVVAAMGEAGLGKSRLFYEFKVIAGGGCLALEAFSVSHGKASAYLPLIDLLKNYFEITAEDDERKRREKITGKVLALDRTLEDTLVYLFSLLGVSDVGDPLGQMDPQIRQRRTLEAVKRLLLRESLNQPLIVVFEDLHWIDAGTQALLNLLVDALATARILLLVNYRPEYRHEWGNRTYYSQLRLDPLGRESAAEMLTTLLGDGAALEPLKRLIIERTEGNPFFMEETVQVLLDEGALVRNGTVKLTKALGELKIPPTVQGILTARIDRLPADEKELLQTLAVMGKEFRLGLVKRVAGKPDAELQRIIADLQLGEFIYEQPAFPDIEYTFKHALTQEVAYNSLLAERRKLLHERAGSTLEAMFAGQLEDHLSELAHHYSRGDNVAKAVEYLRRAAKQAVERSAYSEAAADLKAAVTLVGRLPEGTDRLRIELALHTTEGSVATVLHGIGSQERERALARSCEISERLGDTASLLRGSILLSLLYIARGEPLRARETCSQHLELAERSGVMEVLAPAHWVIGLSLLFSGDLNEVRKTSREWMERFEAVPQGAFPINVPAEVPGHAALAVHLLGGISEALKLSQDAMGRARALNQPFTLGMVLITATWLYQARREPEVVRELAEAAMAIGEEHGFPEWLEWGRWVHGWALAELGDLERGMGEMEAAIAGFARIGGVPRQAFTATMLAKGYEKLGRIDQALALLDDSRARMERSGERLDEAELYRVKGELLYARDGVASGEGESCLRQAIEIARRQESRWWELRATTSLARMLAKQGRRDEAHSMLAEIHGWFTEGFDTADLKDAKSLLEELSA
ncbi:MAG TPA: adenylate/guanylate cyclase domain-containing protein [Candidatus Binataceae bacterium]|nr:adenylate/guanylate cyclase domain-containing protein [Candidatus Binataceae bacterium]